MAKATYKRPRRRWLAYTHVEDGSVGLPWQALTLMSLTMSKKPMSIAEIALDISNGDEEKKKAIYSTVYNSVRQLVASDEIVNPKGNSQRYVASPDGRKSINVVMRLLDKSQAKGRAERMAGTSLASLSDSVLLHAGK